MIDDRCFDVLDRDRWRVDAHDAGALAGRGADAPGEVREIVRAVEAIQRLLPASAVDQVIPLGDQIVDRTARGHAVDEFARVAERDSAVHAARTLLAELFLLHVLVKFLPVAHAFGGRAIDRQFAQVIDESGWLSHGG